MNELVSYIVGIIIGIILGYSIGIHQDDSLALRAMTCMQKNGDMEFCKTLLEITE